MSPVASLLLVALLHGPSPAHAPVVLDDSAGEDHDLSLRVVGSQATLDGVPPVLQRNEVRAALDSGLTATLLAEVRVDAGRRNRCIASVAARSRLDLWDEQYLVTWTDGTSEPTSERFDSFESFERWWQDLELSCALRSPPATTPHAEFIVRVVPFSREEEVDARGWFQQAEARPTASRDGQGSSLLELLLASAIRRETTLTFTWKVAGDP